MTPDRRTAARLLGWADGRAALPLAVIAGIVARVAYVALLAGTKLSDDEISFWSIAGNVASGRGYTYQATATAWRPPLYTGTLAAARWVGLSIRAVQFGQCAIGALTVVLLSAITLQLTKSKPAAVLAACVGAVYPPFVYFSGRLLSENLAIPLYLLGLWVTLLWLERRSVRWAALCGAAWGAAILGRPTVLPVAALCVGVGLLSVRVAGPERHRRFRANLADTAVVVVAILAVMAPWVARNAAAVGGPEPVTSNEGFALWSASRLDDARLKSVNDDVRYPGMQDYAVYGRAFAGIENLARSHNFRFDAASEAARDAFFRSLAVHDIAAKPFRFLARTSERALLVLLPAPDHASQTQKTGAAAKLALWLTSGPVVVLGIGGLVLLVAERRRDTAVWFMALAALGSLALVATHVPDVRYRVDGVDPILIVGASWLVGSRFKDATTDRDEGT